MASMIFDSRISTDGRDGAIPLELRMRGIPASLPPLNEIEEEVCDDSDYETPVHSSSGSTNGYKKNADGMIIKSRKERERSRKKKKKSKKGASDAAARYKARRLTIEAEANKESNSKTIESLCEEKASEMDNEITKKSTKHPIISDDSSGRPPRHKNGKRSTYTQSSQENEPVSGNDTAVRGDSLSLPATATTTTSSKKQDEQQAKKEKKQFLDSDTVTTTTATEEVESREPQESTTNSSSFQFPTTPPPLLSAHTRGKQQSSKKNRRERNIGFGKLVGICKPKAPPVVETIPDDGLEVFFREEEDEVEVIDSPLAASQKAGFPGSEDDGDMAASFHDAIHRQTKKEWVVGAEENTRYVPPEYDDDGDSASSRDPPHNNHRLDDDETIVSVMTKSEIFHESAAASMGSLLGGAVHNTSSSVGFGGGPMSRTGNSNNNNGDPLIQTPSHFDTMPSPGKFMPGTILFNADFDDDASMISLQSDRWDMSSVSTGITGISRASAYLSVSGRSLISAHVERMLENVHDSLFVPNRKMSGLLTSIHRPFYIGEYESVRMDRVPSRSYMTRRKNACGAIKVLSGSPKNRTRLCWTSGVLTALTAVLQDSGPEGAEKEYGHDQTLLENYVEARKRAVTTLFLLSKERKNRVLMLHSPGLLQALSKVIREDDGESLQGCCATLAYLSKAVENRLVIVPVPGLVDALTEVIRPPETDALFSKRRHEPTTEESEQRVEELAKTLHGKQNVSKSESGSKSRNRSNYSGSKGRDDSYEGEDEEEEQGEVEEGDEQEHEEKQEHGEDQDQDQQEKIDEVSDSSPIIATKQKEISLEASMDNDERQDSTGNHPISVEDEKLENDKQEENNDDDKEADITAEDVKDMRNISVLSDISSFDDERVEKSKEHMEEKKDEEIINTSKSKRSKSSKSKRKSQRKKSRKQERIVKEKPIKKKLPRKKILRHVERSDSETGEYRDSEEDVEEEEEEVIDGREEYDKSPNMYLHGARNFVFSMLMTLVKDRDNAYLLARHEILIPVLVALSNLHSSPCHRCALAILAHMTRHPDSRRHMVLRIKSLVPTLVNASYSLSSVARRYAMLSLQNLLAASDREIRWKVSSEFYVLETLCRTSRGRSTFERVDMEGGGSEEDEIESRAVPVKEERLAALRALRNLADEPSNVVPLTRHDAVAFLIDIAHGLGEDGMDTTEEMRFAARDALATLSHWIHDVASSGWMDSHMSDDGYEEDQGVIVPTPGFVEWFPWEGVEGDIDDDEDEDDDGDDEEDFDGEVENFNRDLENFDEREESLEEEDEDESA